MQVGNGLGAPSLEGVVVAMRVRVRCACGAAATIEVRSWGRVRRPREALCCFRCGAAGVAVREVEEGGDDDP